MVEEETKPEDAEALGNKNKAGLHTTLFPVKCVQWTIVAGWLCASPRPGPPRRRVR